MMTHLSENHFILSNFKPLVIPIDKLIKRFLIPISML
ncbi:hypothetical protein K710_2015 [Streptococcus iniae SF1]|nr:hypothetical protein K710_2015 [Streptococcus iniae SF1]